jgi:hypothetical protein
LAEEHSKGFVHYEHASLPAALPLYMQTPAIKVEVSWSKTNELIDPQSS